MIAVFAVGMLLAIGEQDVVATARDLYASAAYEDALAVRRLRRRARRDERSGARGPGRPTAVFGFAHARRRVSRSGGERRDAASGRHSGRATRGAGAGGSAGFEDSSGLYAG